MLRKSSLTEAEHAEKLAIIQGRNNARYLAMQSLPPPMRYYQLIDIVANRQPKVILEVGTWNGGRAAEMLEVCPDARYIGFDLFEMANDETDQREKNVKKHWRRDDVCALLAAYEVQLVQGDTRETLPAYAASDAPGVDLAFIDGGHSVETIKSDWHCVRHLMQPDGVVIFDDYYVGPEIDITRFGCNEVVDQIPHKVLPAMDYVVPDGAVKMVVVEMADLA